MALATASDDQKWTIEFELGSVSTRYNYAQVPNPGGSVVNLRDILGGNGKLVGRTSLMYSTPNGSQWKLLYAPLRISGTGQLNSSTQFAGQTFSSGAVDGLYQFNSYRLTYRKAWKGNWSLGGTLKIRDAEIKLTQGSTVGEEKNVGFVPLVNIYGYGMINQDIGYEIELDGLAGGPGRAFDLSMRATKQLDPRTQLFVGYRILEGGANVPRVKNFAWINYLTAGISFRF
jgi:hypothetical protein